MAPCRQAIGRERAKPLKEVRPECVAAAAAHTPIAPPLVKGDGAIAFGGGGIHAAARTVGPPPRSLVIQPASPRADLPDMAAVLSDEGRKLLQEVDAAQFGGAAAAAAAPSEEEEEEKELQAA